MHFLKTTLTAISISTLVALVGCSDSSPNTANIVNPDPGGPGGGDTQVLVTGEAIKGVLIGAQVTAYELDESGERFPNVVGSARTDEQGEYELSLSEDYAGGLVEVEVTSIDGETTMMCDATRCDGAAQGEEIVVPADFILLSIVEREEGSDTVSASVTVWSTMAASRARALLQTGGSASFKDARRQANAEVSQVLGLDLSRARAKGLSQLEGASSEQYQYALMNAAVAELVFDDHGTLSISAQLKQFTAALNDGRLGNEEDGFSSAELGQAVNRVITANADRVSAAASDALVNQAARLESAGSGGFAPDYDKDLVVDENASDAEKIAAYQTFMGQTRTWLSSMDELSAEELTGAVTIDEQTLRATVDADTQARFQYLGEVIGQVAQFAYTNVNGLVDKLENGGTEAIDIIGPQGNTVGRAELIFADDDGLAITAKGWALDDSGAEFEPFELTLATSIPVEDITIERVDQEVVGMRIASLLTRNTMSVRAQIGDPSGSHYLRLNDTSLTLQLDTAIDSDNAGGFDSESVEAALKGASFAGNVAINSDGYRFNGNATFGLVRLNDDARLFVGSELEGSVLAPKSVRLSGEFISADRETRFNALVSVNLRNAAAFDTFGWWSTSGNRYIFSGDLSEAAAENIVTQTAPDDLSISDHTILGWRADGASYNYSTYFSEAPDQTETVILDDLTDSEIANIKQSLPSAIPDDFEVELVDYSNPFTFYNSETGKIETTNELRLSGAEILESASFEPANLWVREDNVQSYVRLFYPFPFADETDSWSISSEFYPDPVVLATSEALQIDLFWPIRDDDTINKALSGLDHELVNISKPIGLHISPELSTIGLEVPKTEAAYRYCTSNPASFLSYETSNPESACRSKTLVSQSTDRPLTEAEVQVVKEAVTKELNGTTLAGVPYDLVEAFVSVYDGSGQSSLGERYWFAAIEVDDIEEDGYHLQGAITASLGIALPELPEAQMTATFHRTGLNAGGIRTNIDWNGGNYSLDIAASNFDNPEALNLRFYNAQGYELAMTATFTEGEVSNLTGQALINGEEVGQVEWREGQPVLAYRNGDEVQVESLF